jgi:tetraacyldisaccharide 4'-kinase
VLSRGYGRRRPEDGVVIVSDGVHRLADLDRSGDEPLMLARMLPGAAVLVCDVRAIAARLAERVLGASVHVLDDGFQHTSLAKDVEIVLVSPEDLVGRRLPFGRLRSPVSSLARADAVVVDGAMDAGRDVLSRVLRPGVPVFTLHRSLGPPASLEPDRPWPAGRGRVVAVAGIAHPERFAEALRAAGWEVADTVVFRDHHRYRPRDLARIASVAVAAGAAGVVTTEKDAVRLRPLCPLPVPFAAVPLQVAVDPPETFRDWLLTKLREARV